MGMYAYGENGVGVSWVLVLEESMVVVVDGLKV